MISAKEAREISIKTEEERAEKSVEALAEKVFIESEEQILEAANAGESSTMLAISCLAGADGCNCDIASVATVLRYLFQERTDFSVEVLSVGKIKISW